MTVNEMIDDIEIRIDRRTVLLGIIEIVSDYSLKYPFLLQRIGNENYISDIEQEFGKFKNHEVILLFNELTLNYDFSFSSPIKLFLQLNEDFTLNKIQDDPFKTRLNSDYRVQKLLNLLHDFVREINFENFYSNNENRFKRFIANVKSQLIDRNIIKFMHYYFPESTINKFVVNLIPWRTYGCYGTNNDNVVYAHLCCHHKSKNEESVYPANEQIFNYAIFLVHEFSHSFINPIVDKYCLISDNDTIFENIYYKMQNLGYGSNDSILKDHLVRAVTLRYLYLFVQNSSYYSTQLQLDKEWGFEYIETILNSLITFENNRDKYKNIEDFYSIVVEDIKEEYKTRKGSR